MKSYRNDPRELVARFSSVCPETGKTVNAGDRCVYFPLSRKAYHMTSKSAADWQSQAVADAFNLGDAGW